MFKALRLCAAIRGGAYTVLSWLWSLVCVAVVASLTREVTVYEVLLTSSWKKSCCCPWPWQNIKSAMHAHSGSPDHNNLTSIVANSHAQKVLCHCAEVAKNFWCCNHKLCYLQCDWWLENSPQKAAINVNEARRIRWRSPDPLLVGGVWTWNYTFSWYNKSWMLWALTCSISINPRELSACLRMKCDFFHMLLRVCPTPLLH